MHILQRLKIFQKIAAGVVILFMGIMGVVAWTAYSRNSGATGLNMAKIQKMRYDANKKQIADSK